MLVVGAAQYRVGDHSDALWILEAYVQRFPDVQDDVTVRVIAFLAMTNQQLGNTDEARGGLERLRSLMKDQRHAGNGDNQALLREAEELIR